MANWRLRFLLAAIGLANSTSGTTHSSEIVIPDIDHHMHLASPAMSGLWKQQAVDKPDFMEGTDPATLEPKSGDDLVRALDSAGIKRGVILSTGYTFTSPLMSLKIANKRITNAAAMTRTENAVNVAAARASKGRLRAFVSVNPMASGAVEELRYWAGKPGVSGIKLHLANAAFDIHKSAHVAAVVAVVDLARRNHLPLVIHTRAGRPSLIDAQQFAQIFVEKILSHAAGIPVQIAHSAGAGDVNGWTVSALHSFGEAIRRKAPGTEKLQFDLALIPPTGEAAVAADRFVDEARAIGLERFVMGSDWPALGEPVPYYTALENALHFTPTEWRQLAHNVAFYDNDDGLQ